MGAEKNREDLPTSTDGQLEDAQQGAVEAQAALCNLVENFFIEEDKTEEELFNEITDYVQNGANIRIRNAATGDTLLTRAISNNADINLVKALLRKDPGLATFLTEDGTPPLIKAAQSNFAFLYINALLDYGADVNSLSPDGDSALITVIPTGAETAVETLLQRGANLVVQNNEGITVFIKICRSNRIGYDAQNEILAMCLNALRTKDPECMKRIINLQDNDGYTALMNAVGSLKEQQAKGWSLNVELINLLLEAGADPMVADNYGNTALSIAEEVSDIKKLLEEHSSQSTSSSSSSATASSEDSSSSSEANQSSSPSESNPASGTNAADTHTKDVTCTKKKHDTKEHNINVGVLFSFEDEVDNYQFAINHDDMDDGNGGRSLKIAQPNPDELISDSTNEQASSPNHAESEQEEVVQYLINTYGYAEALARKVATKIARDHHQVATKIAIDHLQQYIDHWRSLNEAIDEQKSLEGYINKQIGKEMASGIIPDVHLHFSELHSMEEIKEPLSGTSAVIVSDGEMFYSEALLGAIDYNITGGTIMIKTS